MFKNMKIGSRLFLGFGLVLLLTTATTFIAIFNMGRIQGNLENIVKASTIQTPTDAGMTDNTVNKSIAILNSESAEMYKTSCLLLFILMGVVFAASVFIAIFLTRGIVRPLRNAVMVTEALAAGNLNKDVKVKNKDEIGQLLSSIQHMVNIIRDVIASVKIVSDNVASRSRNLSDSSDDLDRGARGLALQIEQVAAALNEVAQTIMDVAKNASYAADASMKASDTATKGRKIVDMNAEDMRQIAQMTGEAAKIIEDLGERSSQIGEIVAVISSIANQTNLLALNAAIEAAQAGEHGRAFAVVADEVRRLADRTSQAADDIAHRIGAIQTASKESAHAIKRATSEMVNGVALAKEASLSMDSIVETSSGAGDLVQRIAAATEQQSAATEAVKQSMENISSITKKAASFSHGIKDSSDELARLTVSLREMIAFFKGTTKEAKALVKKAISFIELNGKDEAFAEITDHQGIFTNRDLYVFVYDMKGKVLAHGQNADLVGKDLINHVDADNKHFVRERVEIAKSMGSGWQDYKFSNPSTKKIEDKIAYIEKYDDFIVGSGAYR